MSQPWTSRLRLPTQPLLRHLPIALIGVGIGYLLTSRVSDYDNYQVGRIASYVIVLAGLSLLTGANGQISLGHGAFMAVGAYVLALLMTHTGWNFLLELLVAVAASALMGLVIGIPATRLKGPYLAGMTLLFALALPPIADKWPNTFGGDQGLNVLVPTAPGTLSTEEWTAWIQVGGAILVLLLLANLLRSRFGRALRAVRDDEIAASLAGVHVARTKVMAFVISAGCAGLAGALLALSLTVVNTGEFPLTLSIQILAAMVLGGTGSLMGMWWGAILLVYLPQWSTSASGYFNLGSGPSAYMATIIFGAVLIVAMIAAPNGIQGGLWWLWRHVRRVLGPPALVPVPAAAPAPVPAESADTTT